MKNFIVKHKILSGVMAVIILFVIYNIFWLINTSATYGKLAEGMEEDQKRVSYHIIENDGYSYNVKYADYLFFNGNVAVASPDDKFVMVIWPGVFNNKYCIMINDTGDNANNVMVDKEGKALPDENQQILDTYNQQVDILLEKANLKWSGLFK